MMTTTPADDTAPDAAQLRATIIAGIEAGIAAAELALQAWRDSPQPERYVACNADASLLLCMVPGARQYRLSDLNEHAVIDGRRVVMNRLVTRWNAQLDDTAIKTGARLILMRYGAYLARRLATRRATLAWAQAAALRMEAQP